MSDNNDTKWLNEITVEDIGAAIKRTVEKNYQLTGVPKEDSDELKAEIRDNAHRARDDADYLEIFKNMIKENPEHAGVVAFATLVQTEIQSRKLSEEVDFDFGSGSDFRQDPRSLKDLKVETKDPSISKALKALDPNKKKSHRHPKPKPPVLLIPVQRHISHLKNGMKAKRHGSLQPHPRSINDNATPYS